MIGEQPKVDVILKKYPRYYLMARIYEKDKEEFQRTKDESLILYKFCQNQITYVPLEEIETRTTRKKVFR